MGSKSDLHTVVRQGTFDTDPDHLRPAGEAAFELPIIDSEEKRQKSDKSKENGRTKNAQSSQPNQKPASVPSSSKDDGKSVKENENKSVGGAHENGPSFVLSTPSTTKKEKKKEPDKKPTAAGAAAPSQPTTASKPPRPQGPQGKNTPSGDTGQPAKMDVSRAGLKGETYESMYKERNTLLKAEMAYKRRIKQLEEEANSFLKSIDDLTSENKLLRSKVDLLEKQLQNSGVAESVERALKAERERSELENRVKVLEKQLNSNSEDGEKEGNTENLNKQIRELKAQVIKLQTDNQDINEENIKLKAEHLEQVKKLHSLEKEKVSLATSVTDVESEKMDKIHDLQNEHSQMKKEVRELKQKNVEMEKKVDALEFENKALSETLAQKKKELGELLGVMKEENKFDNEIRDLKKQVKTVNDQKRELEMATNREKRILTEELDDYKDKYEKTCKELEEMKTGYAKMEKENAEFRFPNKTLSDTVEEQKREIERLKALLAKFESEAKEERAKYVTLKEESENANVDLKTKSETLEKTTEELKSAVQDKEEQIGKLISQMDSLRSEKEEDKKNWKEEKEKMNTEIQRLAVFEKSCGRLEREMKRAVDSLEESEVRNKKFSVLLSEKDNNCSALEQQIFELNMKVDGMTKRFSQLDREKREIELEKRDWEVKRDKFNDIEASNKRLLEENRRLRGFLEDRSLLDARPEIRELEAWTGDPNALSPSQRAVYVGKEENKKRNQQNYNRALNRRGPLSKSSPTPKTKPPAPIKRETKPPVSPSRSMEDLRKHADTSAGSSPSLPDIAHHGDRASYGLSYRDIHRNRVKMQQKHVY